VNKATALVEMYNSLNKRETKKAVAVSSAHHNSIVGELQNRSSHLLAVSTIPLNDPRNNIKLAIYDFLTRCITFFLAQIKTDVETKGEFINGLINKVHTNTYTDVEQVLTFVDWLDQQLSTLVTKQTQQYWFHLSLFLALVRVATETVLIKLSCCKIQSDETGVLKHFSWPEKKADALREAAFEYRDLKCVVTEVSSLSVEDGSPTSCEATLRKISSLLDK
jgi:hypothetical protein